MIYKDCSIEDIKTNVINDIKKEFKGTNTNFKENGNIISIPRFRDFNAHSELNKAKARVDKWTTDKFGNKFKGMFYVVSEMKDYIDVKFKFPILLEKAYLVLKENIEFGDFRPKGFYKTNFALEEQERKDFYKLTPIQNQEAYNKAKEKWVFSPLFNETQQLNILNTLTGLTFQFVSKAILDGKSVNIFTKEVVNDIPQIVTKKVYQKKLEELNKKQELGLEESQLKNKLTELLKPEVWNKFQEAVLNNLKQFGFQINSSGNAEEVLLDEEDLGISTTEENNTDEEVTSDDNSIGKVKNFSDYSEFTISTKERLSPRLKIWLSSIPSDKFSFIGTSFPNLNVEHTYVNIDTVINAINEATVGKRTPQAIISALEKAGTEIENRYFLKEVAKRLKAEMKLDSRIPNEFFSKFNQTKNEMVMIKLTPSPRKINNKLVKDENGNVVFDIQNELININRSEIPANLRENWFQIFQFENSEEVDNELIIPKSTYSSLYRKYAEIKDSLFKHFDNYGNLISESQRDEVRDKIRNMFDLVNVDLNTNTIDALIDGNIGKSKFKIEANSTFNEKTGVLGQIFSELKPENSNAQKAFGSSGMIKISIEEAKYHDSFMNTSSKDGKNRSIWAYGLNNPFTREMWDILASAKELLKQREAITQGANIQPNEYILDLLKTHYSHNSEILNLLSTLTGETFETFTNNLKWQVYNVTKSSVKGAKGKELKHMNEREFINSQIQLFTNNTLSSRINGVLRKWSYKFLTTPSDKTTMFVLRTPDHKIELFSDLKSVKPQTVDLFYEKFKAEYTKIKAYLEGSEEYRQAIDQIETYEPRAFYSFAQFNVKSKFLWEEKTRLRNLDEVVDGIQVATYVKDKIKEQLEQDIAQTKQNWENYGLIENGKLITGFDAGYVTSLPKSITNSGILETLQANLDKNPLLEEQFLKIKNEADRKITDYLVADYALNKHYFNIEASQLVLGDPTMFLKNKKQKLTNEQFENGNLEYFTKWGNIVRDNLSKRMAGLQGSGTEPVWETETANTIVIQDPQTSSKIIEELKTLSPENATKFSEIDTLDGQEFVTAQEDLALKLAQGKITKSKYNQLLKKVDGAAKEIEENGFIAENSENLLTKEDLAIAQAHKPLVWGLITDPFTKLRKVTYNKPSAFGLYPQFTQGLEIDKLRQSVEKHNKSNKRVDRIVMLSAAKLGAKSPIQNVFNQDGSLNNFEIPISSIDEIPRKYFRIQLEVPYKKSEEIRMLTQSVKLMFNEVLNTNFEYNNQNLSGKDLKQLHDDIYKQTFDLHYENLLIDTGAKLVDGNYIYDDYLKLQSTLLEHAISQGYDLNELEGLQLTKDKLSFKLPLAFSAKADKYEKLLLSLINDVILQKIHGRSFILASEAGIKPTKKTEIVEGSKANDWVNYNKTNIVWSENFNPETGLLPQRPDPNNPNKTLPAQVLVSFKFNDNNGNLLDLKDFMYEKDGHKFIDVKKLPTELLKIIGIRVPTQGHASMADIEIVGFIPDFMGDLIIAPQDFTKQMGSDFDIDKLYSYMYNYFFNSKSGKLSRFTYDKQDEDKERYLFDKNKGAVDKLISAIFDVNADQVDKFNKQINDKKVKVLHNQLQDIYHTVLSNTEVYKKMLEGITEGNLKNVADKTKYLNQQGDTQLPSFSSDRYKITEYFDNAAGKLGIGIYSSNSTFFSLIEGKDLFLQKQQKIEYTNKKGEKKSKFVTQPFPFKIKDSKGNVIELVDLSGHKGVNKLISMFQSASVDNAKLKILSALNIDKNTMGVSAVMAALANDSIKENGSPVYSEDYIIKFISQPSIIEYVNGLKKGSDDVERNQNKQWKADLLQSIRSKYLQELVDLLGEDGAYSLASQPLEGYSEQDLDFGINEFILNTNTDRVKYLKLQIDAISQFEYFEKVANLLRQTQNLTNSDAKGTPQTIQEALFKEKSQNELLEKSQQENNTLVIGNLNNIFTDLTNNFFDLGVKLPIRLYKGSNSNSPILPYATVKYDNFVKEFKLIQNGNADDTFFNALEAANLQNSFLSYIWPSPSLKIADKSLQEERISLIKDLETTTSLATDIEEFKKSEDFLQNDVLKPLFNSLQIKPNKKDPSLKFVNFSVSVGLINPDTEIILSLEQLRELNYSLFEKLIKYSLIVTPAESPTSLRKFISNFYLEAIGISEQLQKINNSLNTSSPSPQIALPKQNILPFSQFILQIFQHYPNYALNIDNNSKLFNEDKTIIEIPQIAENKQFTLIYEQGRYSTPVISTFDGEKRKWRLYLLENIEVNKELREAKAIYTEIPTLGDYNLSEFNAETESPYPLSSIISSNNPQNYQPKEQETITPIVEEVNGRKPAVESNLPTKDVKINIYAGDNQNTELSNFAIRPFKTNVETSSGSKEYTFQSVEQGFHFYKAVVANNPQIAAQILKTTNGGTLRNLTSRSNLKMTPEQVKEWDNTSKSIMLNLMYDSYAQNPDKAQLLLNTGEATITHTQDNTRWKTDFPEVVMTVRDMLREEGFDKNQSSKPIVAYRTRGNNFLEALEKDNAIGNPFEQEEITQEEYNKAKKDADSKKPIAQNFFDGYRPNSDVSKVHTIRPEITAKYGKGVKTFTLVKEGVRTRTTRLANWMRENNPKVGDYFWQVNEKNPNEKVLTRITAVYGKSDTRFKDNWFKEGWVDSNFDYVKNYDSAIEFEVIGNPWSHLGSGQKPEIITEKNVKGKTEQELIKYLKQKYPEIKLDISNNPVWEQGDNVFNQLIEDDYFEGNFVKYQNEVEKISNLILNKLKFKLKAFNGIYDEKITSLEEYKSKILNDLLKEIGITGAIFNLEDLRDRLSSSELQKSLIENLNQAKESKENYRKQLESFYSTRRLLNNFLKHFDINKYDAQQQLIIKSNLPSLFKENKFKSDKQAIAFSKRQINSTEWANKKFQLDKISVFFLGQNAKISKIETLINYFKIDKQDAIKRIYAVVENELNRREKFFTSEKIQSKINAKIAEDKIKADNEKAERLRRQNEELNKYKNSTVVQEVEGFLGSRNIHDLEDILESSNINIELAVIKNNGYSLDKTPEGKESNLFKSILNLPEVNGNVEIAKKLKSLVYSEDFTNWFGDWLNNLEESSKIIDENGEPKLVYHGSGREFSNFEEKERGSTTGKWKDRLSDSEMSFMFTDSPTTAFYYAIIERQQILKEITYYVRKSAQEPTNQIIQEMYQKYPAIKNWVEELKQKGLTRDEILKEFNRVYQEYNKIRDLSEGGAIGNQEANNQNTKQIIDYLEKNKESILKKGIPKNDKYNTAIIPNSDKNGYPIWLWSSKEYNTVSINNNGVLNNFTTKFLNGKNIKELSSSEYDLMVEEFKNNFIYNYEKIQDEIKAGGFRPKVYPVFLNAKNINQKDFKGRPFVFQEGDTEELVSKRQSQGAAFEVADLIEEAVNNNLDGSVIQNIADPTVSTNYAVFRSNQIKSVFNKKDYSSQDNFYNQISNGKIIGQANIKAMTVLVDAVNKKADTIPHEYAHHYIAWFRDTPIVQEAIKRFGSEEALVQAIGEQVVKQKGEAYNWWKKFTNWILNLLSDKQLLQILTDSFLNRQDLNEFTYNESTKNQYGLYKTNTVKEAVEEFIAWMIGEKHTDKLQDYRSAIIDRLPELKGKEILYYKNLGEPSHATALDYLINKYDWTKNQSTQEIKPGVEELFESKRSFADYSDFGKTLSEQEIINLKEEGNKVTAKQFLESITPVNDFEKKLKSFLLSIDLNKLNNFDFVINNKYQGNIIGLNERELFEKPTVIFNSKATNQPSRYKLHEFLHSLLDTVINQEQEFRTELISLYDYVKTLPEFKNEYGVIGWWEFYTEGMTNPYFQAKLKNVTLSGYKGGKKSSVYKEFIKIINSLLEKLGFVNKDYSALDEIINATTKVIEKRYGYGIKPGVQELFESNPELANKVYEALGFKTKTSENQITRNIKETLPFKVIGDYSNIEEGLIGRKVYEETIDNNVYKFEISNYSYENEDGTYQSFYDIDFTVNGSEELVGSGFFNKAEKAKQIIQALLSQNFGNYTVRFNVEESAKGKQRLNLYKRLMSQLDYLPSNEMEYALFYENINSKDKIIFGHPTIGKSYLKKQGENRFITLDDDYANEVNAFIDTNRGSETRQEYKGRKPKEYNEFMLNLFDRLKAQAKKEGKQLFVSNTNILKERMSEFDKVINIPKEEFKKRFDARGATYGFEDWKSDIDATIAKIPSNKIINTTGYLSDLFKVSSQSINLTPQQKQQATSLFSEFLDVYLQDYEQVEKILKEENIIQKKCS